MKFISVALLLSLSAEGQEIRGRIFNGHDAQPGHFKYITTVLARRRDSVQDWNICGGALIASNWILTAAHCLHGRNFARVYLGTLDLNEPKVSYALTKSKFILHPEFDPETLANDIALMLIPKATKCDQIDFVQFPTAGPHDFVDKVAVIMGWGQTRNNGESSTRLQWTTVKTMPIANCKAVYDDIIDSNICVRTEKPYGSHCKGDSGGPLIINGNTIIGIASSISTTGCEKSHPTVFQGVSSYMLWIQHQTGIIY